MKLKQVLTEGPISYRGAGGQRFGAWEEPNDEPENVASSETATFAYNTSDNTEIQAKVHYAIDAGAGGKDVLVDFDVVSIVLGGGKEVDFDTAANVLGDQIGDKLNFAEQFTEYLHDQGKSVGISPDLQKSLGGAVAPAQASAPAAAPAMAPTAA